MLQSCVFKEVLSSFQFLRLDAGVSQDQLHDVKKQKRRIRGRRTDVCRAFVSATHTALLRLNSGFLARDLT